ncbi:MAG: glycosyltransferase family 4 protein, partial [Candidatus Bathyarchaeia archaeon]
MPDLYRAADAFVYMSRGGEGIPRAILEAMASAKPVIATAVAGIPEVMQDNQTGFLVPMNEPTQLAERLCMVLADRGLARRIGDNARSWVQLRHSWEVVAPQLRDALKTARHS